MSGAPDAWQAFETRLAALVSTMLDPADRLELFAPGAATDGGAAVLALTGGPAARLHLRDGVLTGPPTELAAAARLLLAGDLALPHPALLTVAAEGPAAVGVGVLSLAEAARVGADDVVERTLVPPAPAGPVDPDGLLARVVDHVRRTLDPAVHVDDDGDVRFVFEPLRATHGEVGGYLRVPRDEPVPVVAVFSVLLHSVTSPQADLELNVLNRKYRWSRWVRYGEHVVQELSVPAAPFDPALLDALLGVFFSDLVHVCVDLADRVGGIPTR